jgi:hypothetical protein
MMRSLAVLPVVVMSTVSPACKRGSAGDSSEQAAPPAVPIPPAVHAPRHVLPPTQRASGLLPDNAIAAATFVPLDFAKFPKLPPPEVPPDAITVAPTGAAHASIASALRAARPGAVIVVSQGEYSEQDAECTHCGLVADKPVTITARPGHRVVVRPKGQAHTGLTIGASDVVVRGIDLQGFRSVGVMWSGDVQRTVLKDVVVSGSDEGIATMSTRLDGLLAVDVRVTQASGIGFHCGQGPCRNWRLENVSIDMSGGGADSGADAFAVESGDNFLLVNVSVSGAAADGIDVKGSRVVLLGCTVHHVQRNGVKLWQGGDVINTVVHHTGADAALVTEEGRLRLLHSVFGFHNFGGASSYFATLGYDRRGVIQVDIINTIFFNASGGIWIDPNAKVSIRGSLFWGNENGKVLEHGQNVVTVQGGDAQFARMGYGSARIADPRLGADMIPLVGSPARNGGVAHAAQYPSMDHGGAARMQGNAPDIGAFEVE